MPVRKKVDIPIDIPLPIVFDDSFSVFKYSCFIRGCHVYNDGWQPTVCDDSLHCEEEEDNEYDKHAAAKFTIVFIRTRFWDTSHYIGVNWLTIF